MTIHRETEGGGGGADVKEARGTPRLRIPALLLALGAGKSVVLLAIYEAHGSASYFAFISTRWDAQWFLWIFQAGYTTPDAYAFPPLFPALSQALSTSLIPAWATPLVVANVLSFIVPIVVCMTFGFRAALLFELFPTYLVYTTVPYSESLTLLLLSVAVLAALRVRVLSSSAAASLAVLSAYSLAWTLPSFAVRYVRRVRWRTAYFYVIPVVAGSLILLWFTYATGSPFGYFAIESSHWHVGFDNPWVQASIYFYRPMPGFWPFPGNWVTRDIPFEAFYVFGATWLLKTRIEGRGFLIAYSASVIAPLFFIVGGPAESIPRLLLPAFPVFAAYSSILKGRSVWLYAGVCLVVAWWVATQHILHFFA